MSALLLTVLLLFAAFAIDLGALRADRSVGQSVSDMAAAAAGRVYESNAPGSARQACLQAVAYAERNLGVTLDAVGSGCDGFDPSEVCSTAAWDPVVYEAEGIRLTVTIPVADASPLMQGVSYGPENDGGPCQRVGVTVTQARDFFLAGAGGAGRQGATNVSAVARAQGPGDLGQFASLIILDRFGCDVLTSQGSGPQNNEVRVQGVTIDDEYYPGIITVDTIRQGCNPSERLIQTGGGGLIFASDDIFSYHLQQFPGTEAVAYSGNIQLDNPRAGRRITREPVDHLYNCRSSYPASERWSPTHADSVSESGPCEEAGELPPYLTDLHASYQGLTSAPEGWGVISGGQCSALTGSFGPGAGDPETKWFVNCTGTSGNQGFTPDDVHFDGVEAVVTRGQIRLQSNSLRVTGATDTGAVLYLQNGRFDGGAQAELELEDTFVYIHNGFFQMGAGADLDWSAPIDTTADDVDSACDVYSNAYDFDGSNAAPPAMCFAPLALWSNRRDMHFMGGSGDVRTVGSFFTPNARPFRLVGGSNTDYRQSQFFTARLEARGGGSVMMIPNPDTNIEIPLLGPSLIR